MRTFLFVVHLQWFELFFGVSGKPFVLRRAEDRVRSQTVSWKVGCVQSVDSPSH